MIAPTPPRRNDPCPCGSGRRYKDCHGRLAPEPAGSATPVEGLFSEGMRAFRSARPREAIAVFDQVLARDPAHAFASHFKGYALCQLGDLAAGLPLLEKSVASHPDNPDFRANLGTIRYVAGDLDAAVASLEKAIALAPALAEPHANLALALKDRGDFDASLAHARRALELKPGLASARINLALALLALGRYAEAWDAYRWRPEASVNLRDPAGVSSGRPHAQALPPLAQDPWITLDGEQGIGDVLFFLRFAPLARARGARLEFRGDERLHAMLIRSGVVERALAPRADPPHGIERLVWIGDLPALLGVGDSFPEPLRLVPDDARRARMVERLSALGPPPWIGLTWRAGLPRRGKAVLAKEIALEELGAALRGWPGTFVSVQRNPQAGETGRLSGAMARPLADLSAVNDDLDDMLALMAVLDDYVGVSNANMHLRAGVAKPARVLVPWPPEWRWSAGSRSSPWFPGFAVYRAARDGGWREALARLAGKLE